MEERRFAETTWALKMYPKSQKVRDSFKWCVISGLRREVAENSALLVYYAASSVNFLPTFRDNISVQDWTPRMGPIGCPKTSVRNYHYSLRNKPGARSTQIQMMLISTWNSRCYEESHFSKSRRRHRRRRHHHHHHHHQQQQQHTKGAGSRETAKFTFWIRKHASEFPSTPNRGQKFKQVRMLMRLQNRMGISQRRDNVSVYPSPSPTLQRNSFHHSNLNIPVPDLITVVNIPTQLWYLLIYSHENLPKTQTA